MRPSRPIMTILPPTVRRQLRLITSLLTRPPGNLQQFLQQLPVNLMKLFILMELLFEASNFPTTVSVLFAKFKISCYCFAKFFIEN